VAAAAATEAAATEAAATEVAATEVAAMAAAVALGAAVTTVVVAAAAAAAAPTTIGGTRRVRFAVLWAPMPYTLMPLHVKRAAAPDSLAHLSLFASSCPIYPAVRSP